LTKEKNVVITNHAKNFFYSVILLKTEREHIRAILLSFRMLFIVYGFVLYSSITPKRDIFRGTYLKVINIINAN